jgi:hypothetical protein
VQVQRDVHYRVYVPAPELVPLTSSAPGSVTPFIVYAGSEGGQGREGRGSDDLREDLREWAGRDVNATAFCAQMCRRINVSDANVSAVANISDNASSSSSLAFPYDSWVSINGSADVNTSEFCQLICGRRGHVHTEVLYP